METRLDNLALSLYRNKERMSSENFFYIRDSIKKLRQQPPSNVLEFSRQIDQLEGKFVIRQSRVVENEKKELKIKRFYISKLRCVNAGVAGHIDCLMQKIDQQSIDMLIDIRRVIVDFGRVGWDEAKTGTRITTDKEENEERKKIKFDEYHKKYETYLEILDAIIDCKVYKS